MGRMDRREKVGDMLEQASDVDGDVEICGGALHKGKYLYP